MMKPLALYIGWRYIRAQQRTHFISFISLASMLGIALGVAVLIVVLSVMNGFDSQIRTRFFSIAPEVTVIAPPKSHASALPLTHPQRDAMGITNISSFINGLGLLKNADGDVRGVNMLGVDPLKDRQLALMQQAITPKRAAMQLLPGTYRALIGQSLADALGLSVGDRVTVFTPELLNTPALPLARVRRFTVAGIFDTETGFGFDSGLVYINQRDAARLFPTAGQGWHIQIQDIYQAQQVSQQLKHLLPDTFYITDWTEQYGALFHALAMEKTMMFVILLLIVGVAVFNLVSTLVMVVNDKRAEIAILRTLGASPRMIMAIFMIQGGIIGLIGIVLGALFGVVLALNVTHVVNWIQHLFHVQFINPAIYFINFLPSKLSSLDVLNVSSIAFLMSMLATIYPAILAFRTQPAEALRYE